MKKTSDTTQVATKKDIQELRADSKRAEKSLRTEILRVEERVENLEEGQKRMETKIELVETKIEQVEQKIEIRFDQVMQKLDGFVGRVDDLTTDNQVGTHQTRELKLRADDHEKRIKQLESSVRPT